MGVKITKITEKKTETIITGRVRTKARENSEAEVEAVEVTVTGVTAKAEVIRKTPSSSRTEERKVRSSRVTVTKTSSYPRKMTIRGKVR